ncbi:rod shape-determining protein MreD [Candidatus Latescibacterota bacterium]
MKIFRNILLIALALLLQSTLFGRFVIMGVKPDFAILVLIFLVSESGSVGSIVYGFIIGFIQDVYSPEFLGMNAFTMSLIGYFLGLSKDRLTVENYSVKAIVTFIVCIIHDIIYLSFYAKLDTSIMFKLFLRESLPGAVYTSVLLVITVFIWDKFLSGGFDIVTQELFGNRR